MVYCRAGRAVCAEAAAAHSRIAAAQEWRRPFISSLPLLLHILALLRRRHVGIFAVSGHSGMVNEAVPEPLDPPAPASGAARRRAAGDAVAAAAQDAALGQVE